jgi:hypothetical protein
MINTVSRRGKPKGAKTRYHGIGKLARRLRISTQHLRLCTEGKRFPSGKVAKAIARYFVTTTPKNNPKKT